MTTKELAVKKWEWIVEHPSCDPTEMLKAIPELRHEICYCPYCTIYYDCHQCGDCPVRVGELICINDGHPFNT